MVTSAIGAKVLRPSVPVGSVARVDLTQLLEGVVAHRVTLVTGPAGFGKSWLVSDWLDWHADWYQGWVTVDAYDRDAMRLWLHIVEAVMPEQGSAARDLLREGRAGVSRVVDAVAIDLGQRDGPTVVVIDDVHLLDGTASLESLDQFLRLLPEDVHVILIGRRDPEISLAKLRLSGELLEIRAMDLRCTVAEAHELVSETLGLGLSPDVVSSLHAKTLGWIAGIRLAATFISRSSDMRRAAGAVPQVAALEGAYGALGDYLVEEVLGDLEPEDRMFLLDTSILAVLTPPLCDAVTERTDSAAVLEELVRSGMFTNRTVDAGDWYRYHDMFRDALRAVLHREAHDREAELHRRAARWTHHNDVPVSAIEHAIAARDTAIAGRWIVEASPALLRSNQAGTLRRLIERLDTEPEDLELPVLAAWLHAIGYSDVSGGVINGVLERMIGSIEAIIEQNDEEVVRRMAADVLVHATPEEYLQRIIATLGRRTGDFDAVFAAVESLDHPSYEGRAEAVAGRMLVYLGKYATGMELSSVAHDIAFSPSNPVDASRALVLEIQAWASIGEGRLADARTLSGRAVDLMEELGLSSDPPAAIATVPLAWVAYEQAEVTTALELVMPVIDRLERYGDIPAYVRACILLSRLERVRGRRGAAAALLSRARMTTPGRTVTGYFSELLAFESARLALLDDDLAAAEFALPDWRERCAYGARTMAEHFLLARFLLATGGDVRGFLAVEPGDVDSTLAHAIESHKLLALAALRVRDDAEAFRYLTKAMALAVGTGHVQTFHDDATRLGGLLDNAAAITGHHRAATRPPTAAAPNGAPAAELHELLTERELEVVRLLPSHLTYKGMAEVLFVSPNTIKAHLKSIYRKLGAEDRADAVGAARSLGLIDS